MLYLASTTAAVIAVISSNSLCTVYCIVVIDLSNRSSVHPSIHFIIRVFIYPSFRIYFPYFDLHFYLSCYLTNPSFQTLFLNINIRSIDKWAETKRTQTPNADTDSKCRHRHAHTMDSLKWRKVKRAHDLDTWFRSVTNNKFQERCFYGSGSETCSGMSVLAWVCSNPTVSICRYSTAAREKYVSPTDRGGQTKCPNSQLLFFFSCRTSTTAWRTW